MAWNVFYNCFNIIFVDSQLSSMPKPITDVEKIYIKELLSNVLTKSKISLSSTAGYHQLQTAIQNITTEYISVSTIKRLFSKVYTNNPTQASLDIFSKFIGFNTWQLYLNDARQYDKYLLQHELSIIIIQQKIDVTHIHSLCSKYGHLKEIQPFIFSIIRLAVEQKNTSFFETFFTLPNLFNKKYHNEYDFYYLGQAIALAMRSNAQIAKEVTTTYCQNPLAVQYCIESFVDEDYLNDYYGNWLNQYIKHKNTEQALTFYYTLKYKNAYLNNKKQEAKKWYQSLTELNPTNKISKIVEARYFAILLIEEQHTTTSKVYKRIAKTAKKANGFYVDYALYLLRYLFMAKQYTWMCNIVTLFDKYPSNTDEHWLVKSNNALQLYKSFVYHLQKQDKQALKIFHTVNPQLFDPFMYNCMMNDYNTIKTALAI